MESSRSAFWLRPYAEAAGELGLKMRQDLGVLASNLGRSFQGDPTALTYNSFAARILGEYGATIGVDPDSRLIGQAQQVQILTEIVQNWRGEYPEEDGRYKPTSSIVAAVLALSGHIAEQNMTLDQGQKRSAHLAKSWKKSLNLQEKIRPVLSNP